MDQQEMLDNTRRDDINRFSPINIKTSILSKDYKEIRKLLYKKNNISGTCDFLLKCLQHRIIPNTFQNIDFLDSLCENHQTAWNDTTFTRIKIKLEHHKSRLLAASKNFNQLKVTFFQKLNPEEIISFEQHFNSIISTAEKHFKKKHDNKICHLNKRCDVTLMSDDGENVDATVSLDEIVTNEAEKVPEIEISNEAPLENENLVNDQTKKPKRKWIPRNKYRRLKKKQLKKKINLVYNFSSLELTEDMISLLNKGLNFCPNPDKVNLSQLFADGFQMHRKMAWKHHFDQDNKSKFGNTKPQNPFEEKNKKVNLPKNIPEAITTFVKCVQSDLIGSINTKIQPNMTKGEKDALDTLIKLQKDGDIVIQPADKNGGIVVMDRTDYINEAERQLNDTLVIAEDTFNYYEKVDEKEVKRQYKEVEKVLDEGIENGYISKEDKKILLPPKPQASKLYLLPKVHKAYDKIPKGRPIVAGSGCNTERISWYCDQQVKDIVKTLDSYIEDTPDLLRKINDLNSNNKFSDETKPISIDIKSMYTNIPIEEGLSAFKESLESRSEKSVPTHFIMLLLRLVMEKNIFTFNEQHWLQLLGTCMGTRVAPSYANLFMGLLEKKMLNACPVNLKQHLLLWKRFIDDILIIWEGSWELFQEFFNFINNFHKTMKFDEPNYASESNSCDFLDLKISIHEGQIHTDLFRKPTDKPRALLPSSAHPSHIFHNIVYSMAFRLLRICSKEEYFEKRLSELKNEFLIPRGYRAQLIESQFKRVNNLEGNTYTEKLFLP